MATTYSQVSGFFDSTTVVDTVDGFPKGDKAVDSEFMSDFVGTFFSNGVGKNYLDAFKVTADGASAGVVTVGSGACLIRGRYALDKGSEELDLGFDEADRTVIIAQRLDITTAVNAAISKIVITTVTDEPVNTNTVQDIWLAKVVIPGGTVNVTQAMITDLRGSDYCPWIVAPLADADWEALPTTVSNGFTRIATENGGTADAYTATVPNFDPETDRYTNLAVRIVPTVASNANATLAVNGGAAYPIYKTDGDPCALYSLRAGIPVDLIYREGKYFFKAGGSGAEYTKYAEGTPTIGGTYSAPQVSVATLTFQPRLVMVCFDFYNGTTRNPRVMTVLFAADGSITSSLNGQSGNKNTVHAWDKVTGEAAANGFSLTYPYSTGWPVDAATFRAYA